MILKKEADSLLINKQARKYVCTISRYLLAFIQVKREGGIY